MFTTENGKGRLVGGTGMWEGKSSYSLHFTLSSSIKLGFSELKRNVILTFIVHSVILCTRKITSAINTIIFHAAKQFNLLCVRRTIKFNK